MNAEHCDIHAPIAHTVQSGSGQPCLLPAFLTTIMRIRNIQLSTSTIYSHFHVARLNRILYSQSMQIHVNVMWNDKTAKYTHALCLNS